MIHGHGGNIHAWAQRLGCRPEEIVDVSSNINPLGPPPGLMDHLREQLAVICRLPEVDSRGVNTRMAAWLGLDENRVLAGPGTTHFIHAVFPVLGSRRVLIVGPTYADYADACAGHGLVPSYFLAQEDNRFQPAMNLLERRVAGADTVVVCNPNNPTGAMLVKAELYTLCRRYPDTRFVVDESYLPFVPGGEEHSMVGCGLANVIVLHSLSKIHRLPGLRLGFVIAQPPVIDAFRRRMLPWSLGSLAQATVDYLVENRDNVAAFVRRCRDFIAEERQRLLLRLQALPVQVFPSQANFFLVKLPQPANAERVCRQMARRRILVRDCSNFYGLNAQFIRIAMQSPAVNDRVADLLSDCLSGSGAEKCEDSMYG